MVDFSEITPEYIASVDLRTIIQTPVVIEGKSIDDLMTSYEQLFVAAYILAYNTIVRSDAKNPYEIAIDWLRTTDFYTAPASTQYHDSVPGGLLTHSLRVYNELIELIKIPAFKSVQLEHAVISALVHDWCKIGLYEMYERNVKNEKTGQWEKVPSYRYNQRGIPLGHGATSMYIAMKMIPLTVEQALAIRWHMGRWDVCQPEYSELQKSNAEYPLVYLLQFADQLACTEYSNRIESNQ